MSTREIPWFAVINLGNSIIGVSILAMPWCFRECGVVLATILIIFGGFMTKVSCNLLLRASKATRRQSYEYLAYHTLGATGKLAVEMSIIGLLMCTCIAFFVIMGDLGPAIISKWIGLDNNWELRVCLLVFMAMAIVLPLGMRRSIESLSNISTLSILFYMLFSADIIINCLPVLMTDRWYHDLVLWRPAGALKGVSIFALAFSCQTVLFVVYDSLPEKTPKQMESVVTRAVSLVGLVYIIVGFFGYIAFQQADIKGDILLNFAPGQISDLLRLGFTLSVALSFPLIIFPCRSSIYTLFFSQAHSLENPHGGGGERIPPSMFKIITLLLVLFTLVLGITIPNVEVILGLTGATLGCLICFIFPGLIYLKTNGVPSKTTGKIVLVLGTLILICSTYDNLQSMQKKADIDIPRLDVEEEVKRLEQAANKNALDDKVIINHDENKDHLKHVDDNKNDKEPDHIIDVEKNPGDKNVGEEKERLKDGKEKDTNKEQPKGDVDLKPEEAQVINEKRLEPPNPNAPVDQPDKAKVHDNAVEEDKINVKFEEVQEKKLVKENKDDDNDKQEGMGKERGAHEVPNEEKKEEEDKDRKELEKKVLEKDEEKASLEKIVEVKVIEQEIKQEEQDKQLKEIKEKQEQQEHIIKQQAEELDRLKIQHEEEQRDKERQKELKMKDEKEKELKEREEAERQAKQDELLRQQEELLKQQQQLQQQQVLQQQQQQQQLPVAGFPQVVPVVGQDGLVLQQQDAGMVPQQGGMVPQQGGMVQQQGGMVQQQGGMVQQQGGMVQQQGGMVPQQGGMVPQQGGMVLQQGGMVQQQGGMVQQQGGMVQQQGGMGLQQDALQQQGGYADGLVDDLGLGLQVEDIGLQHQQQIPIRGQLRDQLPAAQQQLGRPMEHQNLQPVDVGFQIPLQDGIGNMQQGVQDGLNQPIGLQPGLQPNLQGVGNVQPLAQLQQGQQPVHRVERSVQEGQMGGMPGPALGLPQHGVGMGGQMQMQGVQQNLQQQQQQFHNQQKMQQQQLNPMPQKQIHALQPNAGLHQQGVNNQQRQLQPNMGMNKQPLDKVIGLEQNLNPIIGGIDSNAANRQLKLADQSITDSKDPQAFHVKKGQKVIPKKAPTADNIVENVKNEHRNADIDDKSGNQKVTAQVANINAGASLDVDIPVGQDARAEKKAHPHESQNREEDLDDVRSKEELQQDNNVIQKVLVEEDEQMELAKSLEQQLNNQFKQVGAIAQERMVNSQEEIKKNRKEEV